MTKQYRYASRIRLLTLAATLSLSSAACRTSRGSTLDSWALDGSEAKAEQFIVGTVYKHFPHLPEDRTVATRFARGLMDKREEHAEDPDYIMSIKAAQGPDALESYILLEFATSTNVLEVGDQKANLKYLGPAPAQDDVE